MPGYIVYQPNIRRDHQNVNRVCVKLNKRIQTLDPRKINLNLRSVLIREWAYDVLEAGLYTWLTRHTLCKGKHNIYAVIPIM